MSQSYPIDADLTVTVHDDGTVTWSSSYPMTLPKVHRWIMIQKMHHAQRVREFEDLEQIIRRADDSLTVSTVLRSLAEVVPECIPMSGYHQLGVVYLEPATAMTPHDSSPHMAVVADALTRSGYYCTRSRTRVTVRRKAPATEDEPDFVCTR